MGDRSSDWIRRRQADIFWQNMITLCRQSGAIQFFSPIQSLPNELLSDIFRSACTTIGQPPQHTPSNSCPTLAIPPPTSKFSETPKFSISIATLLSSVCKRWRLIILADLILWSDIDIFRRRPIETLFSDALRWGITCMNRSNPVPMSISVANRTEDPNVVMHLINSINSNSQRIRELKVYMRVMGGLVNDFKHLQYPMPILEVLELGCSPYWGIPPGTTLPTLPRLFSHNYPCLKHVSIQHFTTIPSRAFTNLVTLVLSYSIGHVILDDFLALVAGSPRLEVLWLKRYLITQPRSFHPPAPVSLPRLSSITLENCDSHLILNALRLPDTATLRIMYPMYYLGRRPQNTLSDAFPLDPTIIGSLNNIRTLSYGVDETVAVLFLKDSQDNKLVHVEQGHNPPAMGLVGHFGMFGHVGPHNGLRTCFHDLFILERAADLLGSLTTLELDLRGLPNHDMGGSRLSFWLAFFESSHQLEVLRTSYAYVPPMLDGLNPSNSASKKVLCPSLRTLQLDIRTGAFDLKNDWLLQVVDTARWRGKRGSPFRDLSVYLVSSGYGHEFTLPSDAVRAMFTLRDAGVENMTFSNGTKTYKFDRDNYASPTLPQPFWEDWAAPTTHKTRHRS